MKILIADSFPESHAEQLQNMGHQCTINAALDPSTLPGAIGDHDVLIVRSTQIAADTLDAGSALKLIIRAGAGTNTIDKAHAAENNIRVCNVPGANALAVAELVIGMIVSIDRRIADNVADLRNNRWDKKGYSKARGLYGQKIGILGLGAIGIAVAKRAQAFGMEIFAYDIPGQVQRVKDNNPDVIITEVNTIDEIASTCDIVTLHMPVNEQTTGIVNASFLEKMQPGSTLINCARGELVDEAALIDAMDSKGIRAGLDVFQNEPAAGDNQFDSAIARHPSVCGTHHIGASTSQAQTAVADGVINVVKSFESDDLIFCVNG